APGRTPRSVPGSLINPVADVRKACWGPAPGELPTTWPEPLIAAALLSAAPGSTPRLTRPAPGVYRKARVPEGPTTWPRSMILVARLSVAPGKTPRSVTV